MESKYMTCILLIFILSPIITNAWRNSREIERMRRDPEPRELRRGVHYHNKRHMPASESEYQKRASMTPKQPKRVARKPSGHLRPLVDDDMDNDEVISVAIAPSPLRPKFEKTAKKQTPPPKTEAPPIYNAVNLVKDVLSEITKEFLTRNVNENFVFGQYVGNSMKNLTNELRVNMQHDILDLIVKYQKINNGDKDVKLNTKTDTIKDKSKAAKNGTSDGDETWPDFTNFAGIA